MRETLLDQGVQGVNVIYKQPFKSKRRSIVFAIVPGHSVGHWVAIERGPTQTILMDPFGFHNFERYIIPYFMKRQNPILYLTRL